MAVPIAEFEYRDIRLVGTSFAGEETAIVAPELNIAFDIGRAQRELIGVDHVFLSHGHMDHAAGVAYYFSQRMFIDNEPGHLYAPAPLIESIGRLLKVWSEIDGQEPPANLHAVEPGQDVPLRRDLIVRPFEVQHPARRRRLGTIPSLGYAAIEVRQKLHDEYRELTGPQIVELKKQGVQVTRRVEIPLIAYCGDTAAGDFLDLEYVRKAKVLLLECTFVEADHRDRARAGYHMHVDDLRDVIPRLDNERIVLIHLSRRTALHQARKLVESRIGQPLGDRITFLMEHRKRRRREPPTEP